MRSITQLGQILFPRMWLYPASIIIFCNAFTSFGLFIPDVPTEPDTPENCEVLSAIMIFPFRLLPTSGLRHHHFHWSPGLGIDDLSRTREKHNAWMPLIHSHLHAYKKTSRSNRHTAFPFDIWERKPCPGLHSKMKVEPYSYFISATLINDTHKYYGYYPPLIFPMAYRYLSP